MVQTLLSCSVTCDKMQHHLIRIVSCLQYYIVLPEVPCLMLFSVQPTRTILTNIVPCFAAG